MPKSYVGAGGMRFAAADGGTEPIGERIIVLPVDAKEAELRDPHSGFIDYVPTGSIAKGAALAARRRRQDHCNARSATGPSSTATARCRPSPARPATYIFRQLNDIQAGARGGVGVAFMKPAVANLTPGRHDCARGLPGVAQSVMADFRNLGDLIRRDRDLSKIAIIDLGGEQSPREFTYAQLDAMANGVARALPQRGLARGDRVAILSANRTEYLAAYYGIMRAGFVAVPVNFKFPRQTIHFIIRDSGAKLVFCDGARAPDCPPDIPCVRRSAPTVRRLSRSRPVRHDRPRAERAGDVPLHLGLDRHAEGRRALAREPHLGGADAARARARPPPLPHRRAALSHERAGAVAARLRGACHHRAAAAVHRARLYRGDRALSLHLAHRGAADDRHDAARDRPARAHRPIQRRVRAHGLGAGEPRA